MSFIKAAERKREMEGLTVRISTLNKRLLEAYTKWLNYESVGSCLDAILTQAIDGDIEFQTYLDAHPDAVQKSKRKATKQGLRVA